MKARKQPSHSPAPQNPFQAKWQVLAATTRKRASALADARNSRNVFADRRIAENDPQIPEEDRYLARLQRERTRRSRKRARFSLADDDDQNQTPGGDDLRPKVSLLRDDYDDAEGLDDAFDGQVAEENASEHSDDELLTIKQHDPEADHDAQNRTHQEIMQEVVLKSKMYKAKRQQEKSQMNEHTEKLDGDLQNIMALLNKSRADYELTQKQKKQSQGEPGSSIFPSQSSKDDKTSADGTLGMSRPTAKSSFHYEQVYRQLASEKRARPSNRLLTEEEKAEQEMERLQELEEKRRERMQTTADSDDEPDTDLQALDRGSGEGSRKRKRAHLGGDDLDDGFDLETDAEPENLDLEGGDDDDDDENEGDEQSSAVVELQSAAMMADAAQRSRKQIRDIEEGDAALDPDSLVFVEGQETKISDDAIPYIYKECPSSPAQLQKLFEDKTIEQRSIVIDRIVKCFAPSLNPTANPAKMDCLVSCMLQRVEDLSSVSARHVKVGIKEADMLATHIHGLGGKRTEVISSWAKEKLARSFSELTSPTEKWRLSERWKVSTVLILRAIGRLFPASDLRHPVSTPLIMLLSEALELKRIERSEDIALGMMIGTVLVEQMAEGGRYCGQLSRLLREVIVASYSDTDSVLSGSLKEYRGSTDKSSGEEVAVKRLKISDCMEVAESRTEKQSMQRKIVCSAANLINANGLCGEIGHMDIIYDKVGMERIGWTEAREGIAEQMAESRRRREVLTWYGKKGKVVTCKSVNPKFSGENGVFRRKARTSYIAQRSGDVSASAARVRRALKKEERGLARDVRRAAVETAQMRARVEAERAERREKGRREAMAFLEEQQATWKRAVKRQNKLAGKRW